MDYGINFNGDMPFQDIAKGSKISEEIGFHYIWVGESKDVVHPFPVIALICESTEKTRIGSGVISPQLNRCEHIIKAFETLQEVYGRRFVVGLAPGDYFGLKSLGIKRKPIETVGVCVIDIVTSRNPVFVVDDVEDLKAKSRIKRDITDIPIFIGAASPKMIKLASSIADGVLLNYVHPDFVEWALRYFKKKNYVGVYGPSLILPDKKYEGHLKIAASVVASSVSKEIQEEFDIEESIEDIKNIILKKRYGELKKYNNFLLEKFTISGDISEIRNRIDEFKDMKVDQVIFGGPMCENINSIKQLKGLLNGSSQ